MTSRAWRFAAVLTSVAIASAVLAATRTLAGPAPAGHPATGRARDGSPAVARPVIHPVASGLAAPTAGLASGPIVDGDSDPAADPVTEPIVGPVVGGVAGPAADPATEPLVGPVVDGLAGPAAGPVVRQAIGLVVSLAVGRVSTPIIGPVMDGVAGPARPIIGPVAGPGFPVAGPGTTPELAGPFRWPLDGRPRVVVAFDPPAQPWLPGHRGVDLAAAPAQLVYAAGPGTVAFAGRVAGVGVISIDHAGGLRTTYEPVDATVHAGDPVVAGTPIGRIGARIAGCPAGEAACLHWGLRRGDVYLDPLALLGLGRVRLLP